MTATLEEHLGYLKDPVRLERYWAAVVKTVKPGDRVLDLGCGSGILGLLCLQAGAGFVEAVDSTGMIEVAKEALMRAGVGDRVHFIHGRSHEIDLPASVDVVICDQVGFFGVDYGIIGTLQDARRRFLKPGGVLIPSRVELEIAAISSDTCRGPVDGWIAKPVPDEFHWLRERAVNTKYSVAFKREDLLGTAASLGSIDFNADNPDYFSWTARLIMDRDGLMHGLGGWFRCQLADSVWMTNSPVAEERIDREQIFLALSESMPVMAGERVEVTIRTRPADNLIAWEVVFPSQGRSFSHSTWQGDLLTAEEPHARQPAHVPIPSPRGKARAIVLGYCDGRRTVKEIEETVLREHPKLFPSREEILHFVAHVLGRDAV